MYISTFTARFRDCAMFALIIFMTHATSRAAQTIWVADDLSKLGTVDSVTGTPSIIGPLGVLLTDLAFDPSGNLWGVGGPGFQWLYTVNKITGAATPVGDIGAPVNSLVFSSSGTLYGSFTALFTINTTTAAPSLIGPLGFLSAGDLAFNGGTLYLTAQDPGGFSGSDVLVAVNTTTGAGSLVGPIGVAGVLGIGTGTDGVLYGGVGNHIITINTTTGAGSGLSTWPLFNGGFGGVYGMDIPVPEPTAAVILSLGALAALRRRR